MTRGVADSPFYWPTPQLVESGSRRLPDSLSRGVVESRTRRVGESISDKYSKNISANSKLKSERLER
jgi:hypothetical protein